MTFEPQYPLHLDWIFTCFMLLHEAPTETYATNVNWDFEEMDWNWRHIYYISHIFSYITFSIKDCFSDQVLFLWSINNLLHWWMTCCFTIMERLYYFLHRMWKELMVMNPQNTITWVCRSSQLFQKLYLCPTTLLFTSLSLLKQPLSDKPVLYTTCSAQNGR